MNIKSLLSGAKSILVLGHHNADPDAICSMISVANLYQTINPEGSVTFACDDSSRLSGQVLSIFAPDIEIQSHTEDEHDLIVLVDTNSPYQVGDQFIPVLSAPSKTLVIDHHEESPETEKFADHRIVLSEKSSTCEIIVDIYREVGVAIPKQVADLLLVGMLFDTRRFLYADINTLQVAIELMEFDADYQKAIKSLMISPDRSERIARLKAAGRLKIHNIGDWLVATSKVNAFEASACRSMLDIGADVAIVGGRPAKGKVRLSSRSTRLFSDTTGVNLGTDVMEPLGEIIDGVGGGHPNAAGANGKRNRDKALSRAVDLIREAITSHTKESQ